MSEDIFDRHDREWKEYLEQSKKAREQQVEDEWLIRYHFGLTDEKLPPAWSDKIQRDRNMFEKEWAIQGRQHKELAERQELERKQEFSRFQKNTRADQEQSDTGGHIYTNEDMEKMYENYMASEKLTKEYAEARTEQWETLKGEVNAIKKAYEQKGEEIPQATQRRMAKRIATFRQKWQEVEPNTPFEQWETLTENDLSNDLRQSQSWRDMCASHTIIEDHYNGPDNLPKAANEWMAQEIDEFHIEIDRYNEANKDNEQLTGFMEKLELMRQQQHKTTKPKPR